MFLFKCLCRNKHTNVDRCTVQYMRHTKIIKNHGKSIFFCILLSNKLHMVHCLSNAMKKEILWVA